MATYDLWLAIKVGRSWEKDCLLLVSKCEYLMAPHKYVRVVFTITEIEFISTKIIKIKVRKALKVKNLIRHRAKATQKKKGGTVFN